MTALSSVILRDTLVNRPAAGTAGRLFYDTTNSVLQRDNGSSWDNVESGGAAGSVPLSAFTAAGDTIFATAASTITNLAIGSNGKVYVSTGSAPTWKPSPGFEYDRAAITASVTIASTTEGSETTLITGNSFTADGTALLIEFWSPSVTFTNSAGGQSIVFVLYEDGVTIGRMGTWTPNFVSGQTPGGPQFGRMVRTPSAASHSYILKGWKTAGTTATFGAGPGGSAQNPPAFLRVSKLG